jgi:RNA polymerase sigma factor (sigma-70 family)
MHDATDMDLLRQYAGGNSDTAFAALVSRHVNLVYSAALRKTGNPHAAEEITQAVFIILAQKAGRIPGQTILPGWLYQAARLTASSFLRGEIRRVRREQEAYMQTEPHTVAPDETWEQLAPLLDDAMGQLGDKDRAAVVMRFFGGKSFAEVATAAGVSENAAKKRVGHALEKLHRYFSRRGVSSTTAIIARAISANSVQAAPATLAKAVTAIAVTKGIAAGGSTLALVKGTMKMMTWMKIKLAMGLGAAALLVGSTATVALSGSLSGSPSEDLHAPTNLQQVLITMVVFKVPTEQVTAIIHDFGEPQGAINPNSARFRNLLKQHPDVDYLESPRILTADGIEGNLSSTQQVQVNGTNTDVGITVAVTPTVQPDSKITLKVRFELRELVGGASPSIRVTKQDEQTIPFTSGETTIVIRKKIGDDGQTVGGNPNDGAETLLVFVNTALVKQRLQSIIQRAQP